MSKKRLGACKKNLGVFCAIYFLPAKLSKQNCRSTVWPVMNSNVQSERRAVEAGGAGGAGGAPGFLKNS